MGVGDPLELAEDLVDPDHRLPGERESEGSQLVDDAEHWRSVYQELLTFKRTLLSTAEVHKEDAPAAVAEEVSNDQVLLRWELGRLERRHDFWQRRVRSLKNA